MKRTMLFGALVSGLIATGSSVGFAQGTVELEWAPDHERTVYTRVTRERVRTPPPAGFNVSVGAVIPEEVELYPIPDDVEWAPVRTYRYTVFDDRVYVVEPRSRRVVRVIRRP